jgi:hypothetical protein
MRRYTKANQRSELIPQLKALLRLCPNVISLTLCKQGHARV